MVVFYHCFRTLPVLSNSNYVCQNVFIIMTGMSQYWPWSSLLHLTRFRKMAICALHERIDFAVFCIPNNPFFSPLIAFLAAIASPSPPSPLLRPHPRSANEQYQSFCMEIPIIDHVMPQIYILMNMNVIKTKRSLACGCRKT